MVISSLAPSKLHDIATVRLTPTSSSSLGNRQCSEVQLTVLLRLFKQSVG